MINSLAPMIDQVSNRNKTGLSEVIPKASGHNRSIAIVKYFPQERLLDIGELLACLQVLD